MSLAPGLIGSVVGKYRIDALVGRGGMGEVYRCVHVVLGHPAALKVMSPAFARKEQLVQRFFNEARAAAMLRHANIVDVLDFDVLPDGRPYILLEFLEGEPLSNRLHREGPLEPRPMVAILRPVCGAVGAAHRAGIVHRDLKPDNIFLLAQEGAEGQVKVLDFGVAKLLDQTVSHVDTRDGMILGTPEYMSPEQALGANDRIGPASDVYSLGVIAYRMLSGRVPFPSAHLSETEMAMKIAREPPPRLLDLQPRLPRKLAAAIHRAIRKEPHDRWPSAETFAEALKEALGTQRTPRPELSTRKEPSGTVRLPVNAVQDRRTTLSSAAGVTVRDPPARRLRRAMASHRWAVAAASGVAGGLLVAMVLAPRHARSRAPAVPLVRAVLPAPAPGPSRAAAPLPSPLPAEVRAPTALAGGPPLAIPRPASAPVIASVAPAAATTPPAVAPRRPAPVVPHHVTHVLSPPAAKAPPAVSPAVKRSRIWSF